MEYRIEVKDLNVYFDELHILKNVSLKIHKNMVTALIGPSGCGKSTFIRTLNRMNDLIDTFKMDGAVLLDGKDIYDHKSICGRTEKKSGNCFSETKPIS